MTENLRLGEIDLTKATEKPKFYLCRPDKVVIKPLKDIYGQSLSIKFSSVNELNFTIPSTVERNHELIDNPLIEDIKHRYVIKMIFNNVTEYFIHFEQNKRFSDSEESLSYKSYSLGYQLADKQIRDYEATSKNLSQIASDILQESVWKVNYVDGDFDTKFRSHEIANMTVLQAIFEIAEKFGAAIVWDTRNEYINFYKPNNVGLNKGLKFKQGKYLESFDYNTNSEEAITRLKVYGKEGLTFRSLSPTGSNYLEDFSWYMYPFERDSNGNVIKSSYHMSDSLCVALENYGKLLTEKQGQFDTLTKQLKTDQDSLQKIEQVISVLENQLKQILDELDALNADGKSGTPAHADVLSRRDTKVQEITLKENEKEVIKNQIESTQSQIDALRGTITIDKNLNIQQLRELNKFIIEKEHTNDSIIDERDLLQEGIEVFETFREPRINISMSISNFLSVLESQNDWNKLSIGDIVRLESKRLKVSISSKIIEINYNFESDSIDITIANEKEIKDEYAKLLSSIYNSEKTSTIVNMDKWKWDMIDDVNGTVNRFLSQAWDANKQNVVGGYKQDIQLTERGLIAKSPEDPMSWLILQNGMLAITNDGGNSWKHSITKNGIIGERIIGKILIGTRLLIEDENGIIRMQGSLQEIFNKEGVMKVALGEYEPNKFGLKINQGAIQIVGGLEEDQLSQPVKDKLAEADGIRADLRLTAPLPTNLSLDGNGITATVTGNSTRFVRMDYRGLYVQNGAIDIRTGAESNKGVLFDGDGIRAYNSYGEKTLDFNTNGDFMFGGRLEGATGTFTGELRAASGTFSGNLSAAGGTFTGVLTAATGTFSGTVKAATIESTLIKTSDFLTQYGDSTISIGSGKISAIGSYSTTVIENGAISVSNQSTSARLSEGNLSIGDYSSAIFINKNTISSYVYGSVTNYAGLDIRGLIRLYGSLDFSNLASINWGVHKPTAVWG